MCKREREKDTYTHYISISISIYLYLSLMHRWGGQAFENQSLPSTLSKK